MGISLATCKFPWGAHSQILPAMQSNVPQVFNSQTFGKYSLDSKPIHVKY